jgi:hypothetical protein
LNLLNGKSGKSGDTEVPVSFSTVKATLAAYAEANGGALILAVTVSQLSRGREATDIG